MASMNVSLHLTGPEPVKVDIQHFEDGTWYLTLGDFPSRVTVFVTAEQLDGIRHAISVAQFEDHLAVNGEVFQ